MKKILFLLFIGASSIGFSQTYNSGIGFKGMNFGGGALGGAGINYKTFISGSNALDITVGGSSHSLGGEILYEWQRGTGIVDGLDWFIGAGGEVGFWNTGYSWGPKSSTGFYLGANVVIGLDFSFEPLTSIPIGISLETGPNIGVVNSRAFGWRGAGAIRYLF